MKNALIEILETALKDVEEKRDSAYRPESAEERDQIHILRTLIRALGGY